MLSQLNILVMVHPQLVPLQPVGWILNSVSEMFYMTITMRYMHTDPNSLPMSCVHATGFASHFEVCSRLQLLDDNQVLSVGGALGLAFSVLRRMKVLPDEMVAAWLRREDYVSEEPTWRALVKALKRVGQSGLAETIENDKR